MLESSLNFDELRSKLSESSEKNQLQIIATLSEADSLGLEILQEFLLAQKSASPSPITGKIYQVLTQSHLSQIDEFLQSHFPQGLVALNSQSQIDYTSLQQLLVEQKFQEADLLTLLKLCELAGGTASQRKWLYFSEIEQLPTLDLQTINTLWWVYSEGKFGFSVQRELWLGVGKNWEKLWPLIGWKKGNNWTRYPQEFTWDLSAPRGHLPLSNQLRGVQPFSSLLSHPAWSNCS